VVRKNYPVTIGNRAGSAEREVASVVGPLCTPLDLLADRMDLPVAQAWATWVVFQSRAPTAQRQPAGLPGAPGGAEVLV
jgi:diaminopimelate decarboxylase